MAKVLNSSVHVYDEDGSFKVLLAGVKVPSEYKSQVGDHLLDDVAKEDAEADTTTSTSTTTSTTPPTGSGTTTATAPSDGRPPRAGAGSGAEPWSVWSKSVGIEVPDGANKGAILELVDAYDAAKAAKGTD